MKHRLFFICTVVVLVPAVLVDARSIKQPLAYNHKKHVQELEIECVECHRYAKSMARATIPNIEVCSTCHSDGEPLTDSPAEKQLLDYIKAGGKIPWQKVYRVPSHVYFSHRRHTVLAELPCEQCHGDVGAKEKPLEKQLVPVKMQRCLDCHEEKGVNNDCTRCHR